MALYVPQVLVLVSLVFFSPKTLYFKKIKRYFGLLLLLTFIGISIGSYIGISLNKETYQIKEDITKLITFVFFIGMPFFITGLSQKVKNVLFVSFNIFAIAYTLAVLPNMFLAEEDSSIYPGNLFGRTTVNLTIISSWLFYSLSLFYITQKRLFLIWSLVCYLMVLASLAKWNSIAIFTYPYFIFLVLVKFNPKLSIKVKRRVKIIFISVMGLFVLNISFIANPLARNLGFQSYDNFLEMRVLNEPEKGEKVIRDGARLIMWTDLLTRTSENPWFGIGIGSRALENIGLRMEDHNIFVTHVSRYGIPIFILWLILIFRIVRIQYKKFNKHWNLKPLRYLYIIILLNFFFQSSVGNIWGQLLVAIFVGSAIGLLISNASNYGNTLKQKV